MNRIDEARSEIWADWLDALAAPAPGTAAEWLSRVTVPEPDDAD